MAVGPFITLVLAAFLPTPTGPRLRERAAGTLGRHRHAVAAAPPPRPPPDPEHAPAPPVGADAEGHVFVMHGDVRTVLADAVLMPTRNVLNSKWFPDGPPSRAQPPGRYDFTDETRVIRLNGTADDAPHVWLSHLDGRFAPAQAIRSSGRPGLDWFLEAADQFLRGASAQLRGARAPLGGRPKHLLAMPVVGTGRGGARGSSGRMIARLLQLLNSFVEDSAGAVDVVLVVKSTPMFSAAQAHRRQMQLGGSARWEALLGPRLSAAASELASRAVADELSLFIGAGVSVGAGLPQWQQLLEAMATRPDVPISAAEIAELTQLELPDQAAVLCSRLGARADAGGDASAAAMREGEQALQRIVVDELGSRFHSLAHGLLAGLPVTSVVTTNYDRLFERAWAAAGVDFNVLPYQSRPDADRFVLKLHGDLGAPEDIVLTRSQMRDNLEQRQALGGILQARAHRPSLSTSWPPCDVAIASL